MVNASSYKTTYLKLLYIYLICMTFKFAHIIHSLLGIISDWNLGNHSDLHIRSFKINSFKGLQPLYVTCQGKQACMWNLQKQSIISSPLN